MKQKYGTRNIRGMAFSPQNCLFCELLVIDDAKVTIWTNALSRLRRWRYAPRFCENDHEKARGTTPNTLTKETKKDEASRTATKEEEDKQK